MSYNRKPGLNNLPLNVRTIEQLIKLRAKKIRRIKRNRPPEQRRLQIRYDITDINIQIKRLERERTTQQVPIDASSTLP